MRLKTIFSGFAILTSAFVAAMSPAAATTYDLISDWTSSNPNGPWTYLQGTNVLPYQSDTLLGVPGFAPDNSASGPEPYLPIFAQSAGSGSAIWIHSVDSSNGNPANGQATLTWTAPVAGTIDISGYLYYAQAPLQRSNDYFLSLGADLLQSGTLSYLNAAGPANEVLVSFTDLSVISGEVLSLVIQRSAGEPFGTVTALDLTVTETSAATPLPSTWTMLIAGFVGLGFFCLLRDEKGLRGHRSRLTKTPEWIGETAFSFGIR